MDIIDISRRALFSLEEAREILPVIFRITKSHSERVEALIERLDGAGHANEDLIISLESQINQLVQDWQAKIQKLGALPKGLWIADFDSGDGYFCWKYPERTINFWHRYNDGFSKRISVEERNKPVSLNDHLRKRIFSVPPVSTLATTTTLTSPPSLTPVP